MTKHAKNFDYIQLVDRPQTTTPERGVIHPAEDLLYRSVVGRELEDGAFLASAGE
jgi:hypothetical protein